MKKIMMCFCSVTVIMASVLLVSASVRAAITGCGHNSYVAGAYLNPNSVYCTTYSHQYKRGDGVNGPIYGTCYIRHYRGIKYPQCAVCGDVDYSSPADTFLYNEHENCGLGITHY